MKIEISEVFVSRTDSITMEYNATAIGIAALESREKQIPRNAKKCNFTVFHGISRIFTGKMKKIFLKGGGCNQPTMSPSDTFCRFLTPSDVKKRILFIKLLGDKRHRTATRKRQTSSNFLNPKKRNPLF